MNNERFVVTGRFADATKDIHITRSTYPKAKLVYAGIIRRKHPPRIVSIYDSVAKQIMDVHRTEQ